MSLAIVMTSCDSLSSVTPDVMELDKTEFSVSADGGQVSVPFIPITAWSASCSVDYVSISPSSGNASATTVVMTVDVEKNETAEQRVATIRMKFDETVINVNVTQEAGTPPVQGDPDTPVTPDEPDTPDTPDTPDDPENPDEPDEPETPDTPDTPETPENPDDPGTPENPDTPDTPDTPEDPEVPETPDTPEDPEDDGSTTEDVEKGDDIEVK